MTFDSLISVPALRNCVQSVPGRGNGEGVFSHLEWDQYNIEGNNFLAFMVGEQSGACKGLVWQIKELGVYPKRNFLKIHDKSVIIWNRSWERARNRGHLAFGAFWAVGT